MWTSRFTPKGETPLPPPNAGRTFFVAGILTLAGLSGLYLSMLRSKHKQERTGANPLYEQVLAHVGTKPMTSDDDNSLPTKASQQRSLRPSGPTEEHNAEHISIDQYKESHDSAHPKRLQAPVPQRTKDDDSGWVATKAPGFANYSKKS